MDRLYYVVASFEMGKTYAKSDPERAVKYFKDVMKISDFSWEDAFKNRARAYINALGQEEEEPENAEGNKEEETLEEDQD